MKTKKHITQVENIRLHLENGKSITPIEALNDYGCFRLASVICNLRKSGMNIETVNVTKGRSTFAKYQVI